MSQLHSNDCSCIHEEVGDAESGPSMNVTVTEDCPAHGRAADPEAWKLDDEMQEGYVLSAIVSSIPRKRWLDSTATRSEWVHENRELALALHKVALDLVEQDEWVAERAAGRAADALLVLAFGPSYVRSEPKS